MIGLKTRSAQKSAFNIMFSVSMMMTKIAPRKKNILTKIMLFFAIFGQLKGSTTRILTSYIYAGKVYNYVGNKFPAHCKLFILDSIYGLNIRYVLTSRLDA